MASLLPALIPLGPALAFLILATTGRRFGEAAARVAAAGIGVALAAAVGLAVPAFLGGIGGPYVQLDRVAAVVSLLIGVVGLVVTFFAARYLQGHPRFPRFFTALSAVVMAALALVIVGEAVGFALAWYAIALALGDLLAFRRESAAARESARLQRTVELIGGCALAIAVSILIVRGGTSDIARAAMTLRGDVLASVAACALVVAAMCRSALVPFSGWLVESLEAPTPVSALLHAGIVNGGAILLYRFAPILADAPAAFALAAVAGVVSAAIGLATMRVRSERKRRLVWSTLAQMGFMVAQCGAGAFGAAIVHLVAHGTYKSARFLASGNAIAEARAQTLLGPAPVQMPRMLAVVCALVVPTLAIIFIAPLLGAAPIVAAIGWAIGALATQRIVLAQRTVVGVVLGVVACAVAGAAYVALVAWCDVALAQAIVVPTIIGQTIAVLVVVAALAALVSETFGVRLPAAVRDRWYVWRLREGARYGASAQ